MKTINRYIEHTLLKPDIRESDVEKMLRESIQHQFIGLCLPPFWIKKARRELGRNDIQLVSIAGFPFGYNRTETKLEEMRQGIREGADEIDMVWNLSAFRSGISWVSDDIARCCDLAHSFNRVIKVIIETCYLSEEEIVKACSICADAGADYVKTSTGLGPAGAQPDHIRLMRSVLPSHVGIKASGGIKDYKTAIAMIEAGADRIGTSSAVAIVTDAQ